MIYLVESIEVEPSNTERFLKAFHDVFLPPARDRGMKLVAVWHTPTQIGEDVTITSIFELRDWDQWNDLRKKAVLDPEMPKWLEIREQLAKRGRRHFYTPAEFSPQR